MNMAELAPMTDIELLLAQAMCGSSHRHPCRYHEAQAKLALNALLGAGMAIVSLDNLALAEEAAQPVAVE